MSDELLKGTNEESRKFGAVVSRTTTRVERVDSLDALDSLSTSLSQSNNYATSTARVIGVEQVADCDGPTGDRKILVELTEAEESWPLNVFKWEMRSSSSIERTSVDVDGNPIIVKYSPSVDWALLQGGQGMAFQYTTYESQTAEVDVYIPTREITGTRYRLIRDDQIIKYLTSLYDWQNTINSAPFFGHPKGCVLCLGADITQIAMRPNGEHLLEESFKFITRPGRTPNANNGWNSWSYWKDPNSGMLPNNLETTEGAVVESRHYLWRDHSILYNASIL
jgi:hypothetical protein